MEKELANFFGIKNNSTNFSTSYGYYPNYNPGIIARTSYRARNTWDSLPSPVKGLGMGVGAYALWKNRNHIGAGIDQVKDLAAQGRDNLMNRLGTNAYLKDGKLDTGRTDLIKNSTVGIGVQPQNNTGQQQEITNEQQIPIQGKQVYEKAIGPGLSEQSKNFKPGKIPQTTQENINQENLTSNKPIDSSTYTTPEAENSNATNEDIETEINDSAEFEAFSLKKFFNNNNDKEVNMLKNLNKYYENQINPVLKAFRNFSNSSDIKTEMKLSALNALTNDNDDVNIKNRAMNLLKQELINNENFSENQDIDKTQYIYELNEKLIKNFNNSKLSESYFSKATDELNNRFSDKKGKKSDSLKTLGIAALAAGGAGTGAYLSDKNRAKAEEALKDMENAKDAARADANEYMEKYNEVAGQNVILRNKVNDYNELKNNAEALAKEVNSSIEYKGNKVITGLANTVINAINKAKDTATSAIGGNIDEVNGKDVYKIAEDINSSDNITDGIEYFSFKDSISNNTNNRIFY